MPSTDGILQCVIARLGECTLSLGSLQTINTADATGQRGSNGSAQSTNVKSA